MDNITHIADAELPIDERISIKKHRIAPEVLTGEEKRICVVTGIHGDELEGQYVCFALAQRIMEDLGSLNAIVDIYPAMNPMGIDTIIRGIPAFDLDMNRIFPGSSDGDMNEYLASHIIDDIAGADICIDIHASNIFLTEIPQIRINELHKDELVPLAEQANMDFIWVHSNATVLKSTLAYSLNDIGVDTLVVEMGVGMRITEEYGEQMTDGILSVMRSAGMWRGDVGEIRTPRVAYENDREEIAYLNAPVSGIYLKVAALGDMVRTGDVIGKIIDPLGGVVLEELTAPADGWLFTTREYPVVDSGSLVARILRDEPREWGAVSQGEED